MKNNITAFAWFISFMFIVCIHGANPGEYSIVIIPDTQIYAAYFPVLFQEQMNWICSCSEKLNIAFITHVGDIVEHWDSQNEWRVANRSMKCIHDRHIPHGEAPGNHDRNPNDDEDYRNFEYYFSYYKHANEIYFGGYYNDSTHINSYRNHFEYFTAGTHEYIVLHLEYLPNKDIITWAGSILDQHEEKRAIIVTHAILNDCSDIQEHNIETLAKTHCNVILTLNGHWFKCGGENAIYTHNDCGNTYYSIVQDYQGRRRGGDALIRYIVIKEDVVQHKKESMRTRKKHNARDIACVFTYNPVYEQFELDANSYFSFPIGVDPNTVNLEAGCSFEGRTCKTYYSQSKVLFISMVMSFTFSICCILMLWSIKTLH